MMQETEMTDIKEETPAAVPLDDIEDDEDEETKKKRNRERSFWTKLWQGLAAASLAVNLAAMVIVGSGITIAMGVIACIVAPVVIKQQMDLQDTDTLRRVQNQLRHEVNKLQTENTRLHISVDELETQVNKLQETEGKLKAITDEQETNVDSFVALVKDNQLIIDEMKKVVKGNVLQDIMSIVFQSDLDQSCSISEQEVHVLELRMKVDPRVNVNEENLREAMKAHGGTMSVSDLVKDFYDDETPEDQRIFTLVEEEIVKKK
jgi:hypothetical protein